MEFQAESLVKENHGCDFSCDGVRKRSALGDGSSAKPFSARTVRRVRALGLYVFGIMLFLSVPAAAYAADVIVDNKDSGASWTNSPGWHGEELTSAYKGHALNTNNKNAEGTFKFGSLQSGKFDVYMYWPTYSGSLPDNAAPVVIKHSSGTKTVTVNQRNNGGKWNKLGTWTLDKTAYITLTNRGQGEVYFDAVKLVPLSVTPPLDPTLSMTGNPLTVSTGGATTLSWASENTTSCTASGGWSGNKGLSGSETVNNITSNQTYTLTCSGTTKSVSAAVNVVVTLPPPPVAPLVVGLVPAPAASMNDDHKAFTEELGAHSVRTGYPNEDSAIDWASQNGKSVILMLGYGNGECDVKTANGRQCYADRSAGLVQKYGSKVKYYEVYNEWNHGFGLGCSWNEPPCNDAAMYTDLLCKTYDAIKAVQPSAIVSGGVLAGSNEDFLTGMLDAGAGTCMDMVSLHIYPYSGSWPGHVAKDAPGSEGADKVIQTMTDRENLIEQKTGRTIPILISEAGFNTEDEQLQAEFLTELYSRAAEVEFLEGIWWFALKDTDKGDFGLVRSNDTKKPSFGAFQEVAE